MRCLLISIIVSAAIALPSRADSPRTPDRPAAHVLAPPQKMQPKTVMPRRPVPTVRYRSPLYAFYPPTVIRDGRSFFYYPQPWRRYAEGRPDQPAYPVENVRRHHRFSRSYR